MEANYQEIDLAGQGLNHDPVVRAGLVRVEQPTLRDNTAFADRLARAAAQKWGLDEAVIPVRLVSGLNEIYQKHGYEVWVGCHIEEKKGRITAVEGGDSPKKNLGLAVDVGSTTIVAALVDMDIPAVLDQVSLPNPQTAIGADILTRAHFAEKPGGLEKLTGLLRGAVNSGAGELVRRNHFEMKDISAAAMAGNTTMTHFLLGLPVRTLIREPYVPVINRPRDLTAADLDLGIPGNAPVLVLPSKGSYFGGDLIAGMIVAGFSRTEEPCLMVDVGTNAEVVLGQKDWLIGAAGAAGPALEGGVAARGMVAGPGAIDWVRIDRKTLAVRWRTIGGKAPEGICGSGLIDLFAEMYLSGIIDFRGKITLPAGHPRRMETDEGPAFVAVLADETANGRPLLLSEVELDILTRSKAGMYTILSTVVKSVGLTFDQLQKFYVAGTFGQYIDPQMALAVGMLPDIPLDRFVPLGNSSLRGAVLMLVSGDARKEAVDLWRRLTYLEMNVNQDLMNRFSAARFIPHTDRSRFPSVGTVIK